jgi:hypothetical protein
MSLGHGLVQENAAVTEDSAAAFNWEDGASVGTMRSAAGNSDASSVVYDDSDEVSEEEFEDERSRSDGSYEGSEEEELSGDAESEQEDEDQSKDSLNGSENDEERFYSENESENTDDLMNEFEEEDDTFELDDTDDKILARPIRKLFPEDPGMVEYLLAMTRMAPAPDHIWELYDVYNTQLEEESRLYSLQDQLYSDFDEDSEEFITHAAILKQQHDQNQINLESAQMLFREALTKWQQDRERDLSAQQNNPEGSSPTNEGVAEEEAADANSWGSAGRSSE